MWVNDGNVSELKDVGCNPGKKFLLLLTRRVSLESGRLEKGIRCHYKLCISVESGALRLAPENLRDVLICTLDRTNNRIRSPRLEAFGR